MTNNWRSLLLSGVKLPQDQTELFLTDYLFSLGGAIGWKSPPSPSCRRPLNQNPQSCTLRTGKQPTQQAG